jgi:hypothetical protein
MLLVVACTLAVLFIGSAEAGYRDNCPHGYKSCGHKHGKECGTWVKGDVYNCGICGKKCETYLPNTIAKCEDHKCVYKCKPGYADCDYKKYNGCETNTYNDVKNCGRCHNQCKVTWGPYAEAYCKDSSCKQRCKYGYKYDYNKKCCVKEYHH